METVSIDEGICVGAAFDSRKVIPIWFRWRERHYRVKTVTFSWCTNLGIATLHHYSVSDGANLYELQLNTSTLEWTLGEVCAGQ